MAHELARSVYYTNLAPSGLIKDLEDLLVSEGHIRVITILNLRKIKDVHKILVNRKMIPGCLRGDIKKHYKLESV
jgi:hypothetical protein